MKGFAINKARFLQEMKKRDIATPAALAREFGMNRSTTSRVLKGECLAGSDFVTNARAAWGLTFEELFTDPKPKRKKREPVIADAA
ncbi:XRE family transcriptional regulator [Rhodococcus hoagii]|nr:XRE family transcriptional regulator [Prescottella equi]